VPAGEGGKLLGLGAGAARPPYLADSEEAG